MAQLDGSIRRRRIIGIIYSDQEPPRPCDIECWLGPDGAMSLDFDWSDTGETIRVHRAGSGSTGLLDRIMPPSPPAVPQPGD